MQIKRKLAEYGQLIIERFLKRMWQQFNRALSFLAAPLIRTISSLVSIFLAGLLTNWISSEIIAPDGKLLLRTIPQTHSFKWIVLYLFVYLIVIIMLYSNDKRTKEELADKDKEIDKFKEEQHNKAYVKQMTLEALAKRFSRLADSSTSIDELSKNYRLMEEIIK